MLLYVVPLSAVGIVQQKGNQSTVHFKIPTSHQISILLDCQKVSAIIKFTLSHVPLNVTVLKTLIMKNVFKEGRNMERLIASNLGNVKFL